MAVGEALNAAGVVRLADPLLAAPRIRMLGNSFPSSSFNHSTLSPFFRIWTRPPFGPRRAVVYFRFPFFGLFLTT